MKKNINHTKYFDNYSLHLVENYNSILEIPKIKKVEVSLFSWELYASIKDRSQKIQKLSKNFHYSLLSLMRVFSSTGVRVFFKPYFRRILDKEDKKIFPYSFNFVMTNYTQIYELIGILIYQLNFNYIVNEKDIKVLSKPNYKNVKTIRFRIPLSQIENVQEFELEQYNMYNSRKVYFHFDVEIENYKNLNIDTEVDLNNI